MRRAAERVLFATIPAMFRELERAAQRYELPPVVVVYHDKDADPQHGFRTLDGERWVPPGGSLLVAYSLLRPLREFYASRRGVKRVPPNVFIAFEVASGYAWHSQSFRKVAKGPRKQGFDARTLEPVVPVPSPEQLAATSVPRVNGRARRAYGEDLELLRRAIGTVADAPEEAFLLHAELLEMALDSLKDAELLDPLPVHTNAIWVFERPVMMLRSDMRERAVYAVWFRQGQAVWRIRTYVLKGGVAARRVEMTGDQLSGALPFVPSWDAWHPEQVLLAAVWALMQQGGLTQTEPAGARTLSGGEIPLPPDDSDNGLHVVRVRTGTEHAEVYRQDAAGWSARSAWSVRGHWRRQPYRSLGVDEHGKPLTKLIWIASYTKGDPLQEPAAVKIIDVR